MGLQPHEIRPPVLRRIKYAAKPRPAPCPPYTAPCPVLSRFLRKGGTAQTPTKLCHPERTSAHEMRQREPKDLRLLLSLAL